MARDSFTLLLAGDRLRSHARAGGALLVLLLLVPLGLYESGAVFLWQELPVLNPVDAFLALLPAAAGAVILAISWLSRRAELVAITTIVAASAPALGAASSGLVARGGVAEPWLAPVPLSVIGLALVIAAVHLAEDGRLRRARIGLLAGATVTTLAYYGSAVHGASLFELLTQAFQRALQHPSSRGVASVLMITPFAMWPLLAVILGWVDVLRGRGNRRLAVLIVVCGLPAMLLPAVSDALTGHEGESSALALLCGGIIVPAVLMSMLAHAVAFAARWPVHGEAGGEPCRGLFARRRLAGAGAVLLAVMLVPWVLARPDRAAHAWVPRPGGTEGDRLYGELIPAWNDQSAPGSAGHRRDPTAGARLVATAHSIDPSLGGALKALVRGTEGGDLTLRRWTRLVADVNEASRDAQLPYYLDPAEMVVRSTDPAHPWFRVEPYRIELARRCTTQLRSLYTLHLRWMAPARTRRGSLGMSRDAQPFCLVVLDEIDAYAAELHALAAQAPVDPADATSPAMRAQRAYAQELEGLARAGTLEPDLVATVERHELQHQLDGSEMPAAVLVERRAAVLSPPLAAKLNRELSAYLAQMTAPGSAPRLTLIRLLRLATVEPDKLEAWAAELAFEALLGRDMGAAPEATTAAYSELAALDVNALRERAATAWQTQYGAALQRVECVSLAP